MTCNTISLVSRLIWKHFRWKFTDIFKDVCSLHICFFADSFHLLCCITPCESSGRFFGPPGILAAAVPAPQSRNLSYVNPCCCGHVQLSESDSVRCGAVLLQFSGGLGEFSGWGDLEPAIGLLLGVLDHTSSITCRYLPGFHTGTKSCCLVTRAQGCEYERLNNLMTLLLQLL